MARASTVTLLSLDRLARILGINPLHFHGATAGGYFPLRNRCSDLWMQYSWQFADSVGREDLARAIDEAEEAIVEELGWYPAPVWIAQDVKMQPRHYRKDIYRYRGANVRGQRVGVKAEFAKVIAPGRRAVTEIPDATITYTDADGDGFKETATVVVVTTLTDANEIKAFVTGHDGNDEWEIREPRSVTISGGSATLVFYSWQMIDPDLWEAFPTATSLDGVVAIDLSELTGDTPFDNVISTVDVYRVYNDTTAVSAQLVWEADPNFISSIEYGFCLSCSGTGCAACTLTTQDGCLHVRDALRGVVVPTAATYTAANGWTHDALSRCREPDQVKLWYRCGELSQRYLRGRTYDPLERKWANAIAQMAVARTERDFCNCGNVQGLTSKWRTDVSIQGDSGFQVSQSDLENPFGTRIGEIMAWKVVDRERHKIRGGGAV